MAGDGDRTVREDGLQELAIDVRDAERPFAEQVHQCGRQEEDGQQAMHHCGVIPGPSAELRIDVQRTVITGERGEGLHQCIAHGDRETGRLLCLHRWCVDHFINNFNEVGQG